MNIIEAAKELEPHLQELRRAFHRCPEISGHEVRTAERIEKELREIGGYEIRTGVGAAVLLQT